jgi:hypothetical protein
MSMRVHWIELLPVVDTESNLAIERLYTEIVEISIL